MIKIQPGLRFWLWLAPFMILALVLVLAPVWPVVASSASTGILTIDEISGPPGTDIEITGSGYTADSTYKVLCGTTLIASDTVEADGGFNIDYSIPLMAAGTYKFTATTTAGETTATAAVFTVTPKITIGSSTGKVGDVVSIIGKGFQKSGVVSIYFNSSTTAVITPQADSTGSFTSSFTVPETYQGKHTVIGKDTGNYTPRLDFTVNPSITVAQINASSDSQITVSGAGFTRSSTISFYIDNEKIDALTSSSATGDFSSIKITIPGIASGSHTLKVMDSKENYDSAKITVTSAIFISPTNGPAGTPIRIKGSGFNSESLISVSYQGQSITSDPEIIISDEDGNFNALILAPSSSAGAYNIGVSDDGSNTCTGIFTITASARLEKTSGVVGSNVAVNGSGFRAGTGINIKFDNSAIASGSVGSDGLFTASFKVPASLSGQHKVIITDGLNPITLSFFIEASAQISTSIGSGNQASGNVGSPITVTGSGFTPGATVNVTYDAEPAGASTVSDVGSFTVPFNAPASEAGDITVIASDGVNEFPLVFIMENIPPPTPMCLYPFKDEKSSALTNFQWVGVSDPSGISYRFQLSQDPEFKQLMIDKKALTGSSYQLTPEEKLKAGGKPYYWRVQAVDNASNASPWSAVSNFYVGLVIPSGLLYGFFGLVGMVVFGGGFVIGSRWGAKISAILSRFKKGKSGENADSEEAADSEA